MLRGAPLVSHHGGRTLVFSQTLLPRSSLSPPPPSSSSSSSRMSSQAGAAAAAAATATAVATRGVFVTAPGATASVWGVLTAGLRTSAKAAASIRAFQSPLWLLPSSSSSPALFCVSSLSAPLSFSSSSSSSSSSLMMMMMTVNGRRSLSSLALAGASATRWTSRSQTTCASRSSMRDSSSQSHGQTGMTAASTVTFALEGGLGAGHLLPIVTAGTLVVGVTAAFVVGGLKGLAGPVHCQDSGGSSGSSTSSSSSSSSSGGDGGGAIVARDPSTSVPGQPSSSTSLSSSREGSLFRAIRYVGSWVSALPLWSPLTLIVPRVASPTAKVVLLAYPHVTSPGGLTPFVYRQTRHRIYEFIKSFYMTFTILPLRLVAAAVVVPLMVAFSWASVAGLSEEALKEPLTPWRRAVRAPAQYLLRALLFIAGFYWIDVKGVRDPSAPILVVAPHTSYLDTAYLMVQEWPSLVASSYIYNIPFFGAILRGCQPVVIDRTDKAARAEAAAEIRRRATMVSKIPSTQPSSPAKPSTSPTASTSSSTPWRNRPTASTTKDAPSSSPSTTSQAQPQQQLQQDTAAAMSLVISPEGCCTNGESLVTFSTGAFQPGVKVQPVLIRFPNKFFDPAWTGSEDHYWIMYRLLCQFVNFMTVEYLPAYTPSAQEVADAALFAHNVQNTMAAAWNLPVSLHSYYDVQMGNLAEELGLPRQTGVVEVLKLSALYGVSVNDCLSSLKDFKAAGASKDGLLTLTPDLVAKHSFNKREGEQVSLTEFILTTRVVSVADTAIAHAWKASGGSVSLSGSLDMEAAIRQWSLTPNFPRRAEEWSSLVATWVPQPFMSWSEFEAFCTRYPEVVTGMKGVARS